MSASFSFTPYWGVQPRPDGGADIRIWAPASKEVVFVSDAGEVRLSDDGDGWRCGELREFRPGAHYSFRLDDGRTVPDPAARAQAGDVHGSSLLVDPHGYKWRHPDWRGRSWSEAVIYELHIGAFTPEGTFEAAIGKLDHLAKLGVTVIELMPVAQFGGTRGWGYDGVLHYAPHNAYGGVNGMKAFIDAAHERGLMVILDVVYNHFGPDGNYLHLYAPQFFDDSRHTAWGAAIAYDQPAVRRFFIDNALYWLEEYRLDGFRFDAIDQIIDPSQPHILEDIASVIRERVNDRHIHLTTEDSRNITFLHERDEKGEVKLFTGEWNDDYHNAAHVVATGESEGYYADFADAPLSFLARSLAEGYAYQGEPSQYLGENRGEPSGHLPPDAFIDFLQNHDQIGNRAFGERLTTLADPALLKALTAMTTLSPSIPLLFMGEEWGERNPFLYFTDFHGELAAAVREGRRREFRAWSEFSGDRAAGSIPDPNARATFDRSRIDWRQLESAEGQSAAAFHRKLLHIRARVIAPLLEPPSSCDGLVREARDGVLAVSWTFGAATLHLDANLSATARARQSAPPRGDMIFSCFQEDAPAQEPQLPPYSVFFRLDSGEGLASPS